MKRKNSRANLSEEQVDLSEQFADLFHKNYGDTYTSFAALVIPHLVNGCSWGFFDESTARNLGVAGKKFTEHPDPNVWLGKMKNGYLVHLDYNMLLQRMNDTIPLFDQTIIDAGARHKEKSYEKLCKLLARGEQDLYMGFLCTNDGSTITIDGVGYPAYNVDVHTLAEAARYYGYNFQIDGHEITPDTMENRINDLLPHISIAPSNHAALVVLSKAQ